MRIAHVALVVAMVGSSRRARADERRDDAAGCYASARTAYANADYRGAAVLFACAHRYAGKPELKYNEGISWELAGEDARAADAFALFLAQSKLDIPDKKEDARLRIERLVTRLFTLTLSSGTAAARATVGSTTDASLPSTLHLAPGRYRLEVAAPGHASRTEEIVAVAGGAAALDIELTPAPSQSPAPTPKPAPAPSPDRWLTVGWAGLAFSGASGVAAVVLGLEVDRTLGDFEDGGRRSRPQHDTAVALRTATNVAWIAAAAVGAASVTLLVVRMRRASSSARLGAGGAGASLSITF